MSHTIAEINRTPEINYEIQQMLQMYQNYGYKNLVVSDCLISRLSLILDPKMLIKYGFKEICKFSNRQSYAALSSKAFIIPASIDEFQAVLNFCFDSISDMSTSQLAMIKMIVFVIPVIEPYFVRLIEQSGLYGILQVESLDIATVQFDVNLFGCMCPMEFFEYSNAALCVLMSIVNKYGPIPNICTIGSQSKSLVDFAKKTVSPNFIHFDQDNTVVGHLMLIDRALDWTPVFKSSINFESLVDKKFGIKFGQTALPKSSADNSGKRTLKSVLLNSFDPLYYELRQLPISKIHSVIHEQMSRNQYRLKKNASLTDTKELRNFFESEHNQLKLDQQSIEMFMATALELINHASSPVEAKLMHFEHEILERTDFQTSFNNLLEICNIPNVDAFEQLRLICLFVLSFSSKLTNHEIGMLQQEFIACHGFKYIKLFSYLEQCKIMPFCYPKNNIKQQPQEEPTTTTDKVLNQGAMLLNKFSLMGTPTDSNEISASRKALMKRLKVALSSNKESNSDSQLDPNQDSSILVQIVHYWIKCKSLGELTPDLSKIVGPVKVHSALDPNASPRRMILLLIGGLTYAELNLLKAIEKETGFKIIIYTTDTLNANSLFKMGNFDNIE